VTGVRSAQLALLVFSIFAFMLLTLFIPFQSFSKPDWGVEHKYKILAAKVFFKVATFACTIATIVIAYGTLTFWNAINKGSPCSDPLTSETFTVLGNTFAKLSQENLINGIFSGATTGFDFFQHIMADIMTTKM